MPPSTFSGSTEPTGYLIEYDPRPSEAPPLLSLLKRYILRSKVTSKDASDRYDVWAAWGGETSTEPFERQWRFGNRGAVEPVWENHEAWRGAGFVPTSLRDLRGVGMGLRMLVRKGDPREWHPYTVSISLIVFAAQLASDHDIVKGEEYTVHRIMRGVPEGIVDLPPMQAIAMNSNLDMMGGSESSAPLNKILD
jgi:folate-binding Fe-S cluster repair protein YgfZ